MRFVFQNATSWLVLNMFSLQILYRFYRDNEHEYYSRTYEIHHFANDVAIRDELNQTKNCCFL